MRAAPRHAASTHQPSGATRQAGGRETLELGRCLVPWAVDLENRAEHERAREAARQAIAILHQAAEVGREAEELFSRIGAERQAAYKRAVVAVAIRRLGQVTEAHALMSQSVRQLLPCRDQFDLAGLAEDYGALLFSLGYAELAPMLFAAATAARQRDGLPRDEDRQAMVEETSALARVAMSAEQWQPAFELGLGMELQDALLDAVSIPLEGPAPSPP